MFLLETHDSGGIIFFRESPHIFYGTPTLFRRALLRTPTEHAVYSPNFFPQFKLEM